jgi:hypothetical protein
MGVAASVQNIGEKMGETMVEKFSLFFLKKVFFLPLLFLEKEPDGRNEEAEDHDDESTDCNDAGACLVVWWSDHLHCARRHDWSA